MLNSGFPIRKAALTNDDTEMYDGELEADIEYAAHAG
jgi:hypothetical protein